MLLRGRGCGHGLSLPVCVGFALALHIVIVLGIARRVLDVAPRLLRLALHLLGCAFHLRVGVSGPLAHLALGATGGIVDGALHSVFIHNSTSVDGAWG